MSEPDHQDIYRERMLRFAVAENRRRWERDGSAPGSLSAIGPRERVLAILRDQPIQTAEIAEMAGVGLWTARRALNKLQAEGLAKPSHSTRPDRSGGVVVEWGLAK